MKRLIIIIILTAAGIGLTAGVMAKERNFFYFLRIDAPTIVKGYTVKTPDGLLTLGILPETLDAETVIEFKNLSAYISGLDLNVLPDWAASKPENMERVSDIYEFNILNKDSFHDKKPLILELSYYKEPGDLENNLKQLYFWNGVTGAWQKLPSKNLRDKNSVRSLIHLPYARLAIFANSNILEVGEASWYGYKNCDCAASPDYPKDTLLRVTNLTNDKSVIVKVNDYGPDRSIYPQRIIDMDRIAFRKLAHLSQGIIPRVKVELINKSN